MKSMYGWYGWCWSIRAFLVTHMTHFWYQKNTQRRNDLEPIRKAAERLCLSAVGRESASSSCKSLKNKTEAKKLQRTFKKNEGSEDVVEELTRVNRANW